MITGVGHYGADGGTGATALTICRSTRSITTVDSCMKGPITVLISAVFRKCFKGGGEMAKLRFQEIREGESGIQLFSVIYAILIDIRLDEFQMVRGGGCGGARKKQGGASAYNHIHSTYVHSLICQCVKWRTVNDGLAMLKG